MSAFWELKAQINNRTSCLAVAEKICPIFFMTAQHTNALLLQMWHRLRGIKVAFQQEILLHHLLIIVVYVNFFIILQ